jgi:branched-chain amino acid transport system substrate-binding protein
MRSTPARTTVAIAAATVIALSASACGGGGADSSASSGTTLTFAIVGPLSGDNATYGKNQLRGAQLAVKEINAAGGIDGKKVVLKRFDDKCEPTEAANVASRITSDASIQGVLGHLCSAATLAALPVYQRSSLAVISGSSTAPKITTLGYKNFSRTIPNDDAQGTQITDFAAGQLGKKKLAIVYAGDDYGQGLNDKALKEASAAGAEIVGDVTYTPNQTKDFTPQLTKLAAAKPDALLMLGYYNDMGTMVSQLDRAGMTGTTLVGAAGVLQPDYIKLGGAKATDGSYLLGYYDPASPLAANKEYVKKFEAAYKGEQPNEQAAYWYEIPYIIKAAYDSGATKATLAAKIRAVTYEGPTGRTAFSSTGDVTGKSGVIVTVKGGKLVLDSARTAAVNK